METYQGCYHWLCVVSWCFHVSTVWLPAASRRYQPSHEQKKKPCPTQRCDYSVISYTRFLYSYSRHVQKYNTLFHSATTAVKVLLMAVQILSDLPNLASFFFFLIYCRPLTFVLCRPETDREYLVDVYVPIVIQKTTLCVRRRWAYTHTFFIGSEDSVTPTMYGM